MNELRKKLRSGDGFTLVEMLIVVAIIAILVAVSIPMVSSSLAKSQHATDAANERSAKSQIIVDSMLKGTAGKVVGYYDAAAGTIKSAGTDITAYGKHHKNTMILAVSYDPSTATAIVQWVEKSSAGSAANPSDDKKLCSTTENANDTTHTGG